MTKGQWVAAEHDRAIACETAFQHGGPKVYVYDKWQQIPSQHSATYSIQIAGPAQTIYARRKQRNGRYEWMKWMVEEVAAPASPTTANGDNWLGAIAKAGERQRQEHAALQEKLGEPDFFLPDDHADPRFGTGFWRVNGGVATYRKFANGYSPESRMEYTNEFIGILVMVQMTGKERNPT